MKTSVHIVHAFTQAHTGGNPAGVVLEADAVSAAQKQSIARQVGLSETAFVSSSTRATLKVEFFTPTRQIAHCGHATVAAFSLCRGLGLLQDGLHTKESIDGILGVTLRDRLAFLHQPPTRYRHLAVSDAHGAAALAALGLAPPALLNGAPLSVARAANGFLLVPLRDEETLRALQPDMQAIHALSESLDLVGFYPFVVHPPGNASSASARMFAPRYGIEEESATGTAAGPLGCWLHDVLGLEAMAYRIGQGRHMPNPSPSLLHVALEAVAGGVSAARIGGEGLCLKTIEIDA